MRRLAARQCSHHKTHDSPPHVAAAYALRMHYQPLTLTLSKNPIKQPVNEQVSHQPTTQPTNQPTASPKLTHIHLPRLTKQSISRPAKLDLMIAHLGAEDLFRRSGQQVPLDKECSNIIVASQRLEELLEQLEEAQVHGGGEKRSARGGGEEDSGTAGRGADA
eukprot:354784-Chlamydomonas_euryale.AAC.1